MNLYIYLSIILIIYNILFLGIGDWAQSPIPNPQSPILIKNNLIKVNLINLFNNK